MVLQAAHVLVWAARSTVLGLSSVIGFMDAGNFVDAFLITCVQLNMKQDLYSRSSGVICCHVFVAGELDEGIQRISTSPQR